MKRSIRMNKKDDVSTVLENIEKGEKVGIYDEENNFLYFLRAKDNIPFGNKISLVNKKAGELIFKYGEIIGKIIKDIEKGELVHIQNVKSLTVDIPERIKKEIIRQMNIKIK